MTSSSSSNTNSSSGFEYEYWHKENNKAMGAIYGAIIGNSIGSFQDRQQWIGDDMKNQSLIGTDVQRKEQNQEGQLMIESKLMLILMKEMFSCIQVHCYSENQFEFTDYDIQTIISKYMDLHNQQINSGVDDLPTKKALEKSISESRFTEYQQSVESDNANKDSNGHLIRVLPISLVFTDYNSERLIPCLQKEMNITHYSETILYISYFYSKAIILLIQNTPLKQVYSDIKTEIQQSQKFKDLSTQIQKMQTYIQNMNNPSTLLNVQSDISQSTAEIPPENKAIYSWCQCLMYLKKNQDKDIRTLKGFEEDMQYFCKNSRALKTNLMIFGGFIGAIYGFRKIPNQRKTDMGNILKQGTYYDIIKDFTSINKSSSSRHYNTSSICIDSSNPLSTNPSYQRNENLGFQEKTKCNRCNIF